ncbi:MAG: pyruvate dehydrogenase (acetyl-transferring), homodimeric type [Planctomycetota bacterium]|nr:pyruvate dehydrogenase (acetyl-transferring), homodimeric type [Planctomycetota bacterium]
MNESNEHLHEDADPAETAEWRESIDSVADAAGPGHAGGLLDRVVWHAQSRHVPTGPHSITPYQNTISAEQEPPYPGDEQLEDRIERIIRWNAMAMVVRANTQHDGLGGHMSTFASAATLYEVGQQHFFRGLDDPGGGDQIYFQGHASPGMYARAYLEGQIDESQLDRFRQEVAGNGLSSYPHPRLMPDFWQFPTVSMGLGPINAIYQAHFNRYLHARGIKDTSNQRVWGFIGDGECDEPETLGAIRIAQREKLDNLVFVINCNLLRLDGPVTGNASIIQDLEGVFHGSGWRVIKVIWDRSWDPLLEADRDGLLLQKLGTIVDGVWQRSVAEDGAWLRQQLCDGEPQLTQFLSGWSDDQLKQLGRGGHDRHKVAAAYHQACQADGRPTVILTKTIKGQHLGPQAAAKNVSHQLKKLKSDEVEAIRDLLEIPISDTDIGSTPYYHPGPDSPEIRYLQERRAALGGSIPRRRSTAVVPALPEPQVFEKLHGGTGESRPASTTMAFARLFRDLLKVDGIGERIVPILADEARTFGMEALFKQVGIYTPGGQKYEPVDHSLLFSYTEKADGQILQEGLSECGSLATLIASATSYSTHGEVTLPFFIFYSMFGFQRVGDQIWSLGDGRGRGFLLGATAGRTTLNGEGLQHQDGHSLIIAGAYPSCIAYDPAFAYEVAVVIEEGIRRMVGEQEDVFFYLTLYNENLDMPAMPEGSREGILKGLYRLDEAPEGDGPAIRLLGSGPCVPRVRAAASALFEHHGIRAEVWSATSYTELRRQAMETDRWNLLHPESTPRIPFVSQLLNEGTDPVVAVTDYMRELPDMIRSWVSVPWRSLGTDGFGRSDTRDELRRFFETDQSSIEIAALATLAQDNKIDAKVVQSAIERHGIDPELPPPWMR